MLIAGKFFGGALVGKIVSSKELRKENADRSNGFTPKSLGIWLIPRGEFSFVIGQLGLALGLIDQTLFSIIGLSVLVSTIVTSILQLLSEPKIASSMYLFKGRTDDA